MANSVTTFLMFQKRDAEEAMRWYAALVPGAEITAVQRYGPGEQGPEGTLSRGELTMCGQHFRFYDSPVKHEFEFTPSTSLFVECSDADELERLFAALSDGGQVLMPLSSYGFSTRFGWCNDRYGVSWQVNLA